MNCSALFTTLNAKLRQGIHYSASLSEMTEIPELVLKTILLATATLSLFPNWVVTVRPLFNFSKESKEYFNIIKVGKSIDGFVNHPKSDWKFTARNICGLVLFFFSSVFVLEKFQLADFSRLHGRLEKIPLLGTLPDAGLPYFATIGLFTSLFLIAVDNRKVIVKANGQVNDLERHSNTLYLTQRCFGIASVVTTIYATVVSSFPVLIAAGCLSCIEVGCGISNVALKYAKSRIHFSR